jgi:hypothetical protein
MFKYQDFGVRYCDGKQVGTSLHGVNHINQWNSLKLVGGGLIMMVWLLDLQLLCNQCLSPLKL